MKTYSGTGRWWKNRTQSPARPLRRIGGLRCRRDALTAAFIGLEPLEPRRLMSAAPVPVVTITATDPTASLRANYDASADIGQVVLTRSGGDASRSLSVGLILDGTASAIDRYPNYADYGIYDSLTHQRFNVSSIPLNINGKGISLAVIEFAPDQTSVTLDVAGLYSYYYAPVPDMQAILMISGTPDGSYTVGPDSQSAAQIEFKGDMPVITITASDPIAVESENPDASTEGIFTLTRTGSLDYGLDLHYSLLDIGSSLQGDHALVTSNMNSYLDGFAPGQDTLVIHAQAVEDFFDDPDRQIRLVLSPNDRFAVTDHQEQGPVVNVYASSLLFYKTNDPQTDFATLTFTRSGGDLNAPLLVNYELEGGLALGVDYAAPVDEDPFAGGLQVRFDPGQTVRVVKIHSIYSPQVPNVFLDEYGNSSTVIAHLLAGSNTGLLTRYQLPRYDGQTAELLLNRLMPSVHLEAPNTNLTEINGGANPDAPILKVVRVGPYLGADLPVELHIIGEAIRDIDGVFTDGEDYRLVDAATVQVITGSTVVIPAGQSVVTLRLEIADDHRIENLEHIDITLPQSPFYMASQAEPFGGYSNPTRVRFNLEDGVTQIGFSTYSSFGNLDLQELDSNHIAGNSLNSAVVYINRTGDVGQPLDFLVHVGGTATASADEAVDAGDDYVIHLEDASHVLLTPDAQGNLHLRFEAGASMLQLRFTQMDETQAAIPLPPLAEPYESIDLSIPPDNDGHEDYVEVSGLSDFRRTSHLSIRDNEPVITSLSHAGSDSFAIEGDTQKYGVIVLARDTISMPVDLTVNFTAGGNALRDLDGVADPGEDYRIWVITQNLDSDPNNDINPKVFFSDSLFAAHGVSLPAGATLTLLTGDSVFMPASSAKVYLFYQAINDGLAEGGEIATLRLQPGPGYTPTLQNDLQLTSAPSSGSVSFGSGSFSGSISTAGIDDHFAAPSGIVYLYDSSDIPGVPLVSLDSNDFTYVGRNIQDSRALEIQGISMPDRTEAWDKAVFNIILRGQYSSAPTEVFFAVGGTAVRSADAIPDPGEDFVLRLADGTVVSGNSVTYIPTMSLTDFELPGNDPQAFATAQLAIYSQPLQNQTIELCNSSGSYVLFRFTTQEDSDPQTVRIGATVQETADNLVSAIAAAGWGVSGSGLTYTLIQNQPGSVGVNRDIHNRVNSTLQLFVEPFFDELVEGDESVILRLQSNPGAYYLSPGWRSNSDLTQALAEISTQIKQVSIEDSHSIADFNSYFIEGRDRRIFEAGTDQNIAYFSVDRYTAQITSPLDIGFYTMGDAVRDLDGIIQAGEDYQIWFRDDFGNRTLVTGNSFRVPEGARGGHLEIVAIDEAQAGLPDIAEHDEAMMFVFRAIDGWDQFVSYYPIVIADTVTEVSVATEYFQYRSNRIDLPESVDPDYVVSRASFRVDWGGPIGDQPVYVNYSLGGSATPGVDYSTPPDDDPDAPGLQLRFDQDHQSRYIDIVLFGDKVYDPNETILFTLLPPAIGDGYTVYNPKSPLNYYNPNRSDHILVVIGDVDAEAIVDILQQGETSELPEISLTAAQTVVQESLPGDLSPGTHVRLTRTGGLLDQALKVHLNIGGSAIRATQGFYQIGADYFMAPNAADAGDMQEIIFAPGQTTLDLDFYALTDQLDESI